MSTNFIFLTFAQCRKFKISRENEESEQNEEHVDAENEDEDENEHPVGHNETRKRLRESGKHPKELIANLARARNAFHGRKGRLSTLSDDGEDDGDDDDQNIDDIINDGEPPVAEIDVDLQAYYKQFYVDWHIFTAFIEELCNHNISVGAPKGIYLSI